MKRILYFDVETTGLDPLNCSIIQIAGIMEIDAMHDIIATKKLAGILQEILTKCK